MAKIVKDCIFEIIDSETGDVTEKTIKDVEDDSRAYNRLRKKIIDNKNLSIREFERKYDVERRRSLVKFADQPWSDHKELERELEKLSSVDHTLYQSPLQGTYGPPKFTVRTNNKFDTVKKQVKGYYDGLVVEKNNGKIEVIVSSIKADKKS